MNILAWCQVKTYFLFIFCVFFVLMANMESLFCLKTNIVHVTYLMNLSEEASVTSSLVVRNRYLQYIYFFLVPLLAKASRWDVFNGFISFYVKGNLTTNFALPLLTEEIIISTVFIYNIYIQYKKYIVCWDGMIFVAAIKLYMFMIQNYS